jgi:cytochrome b
MNNENTVQVWDILVRIFHWLLVTSVIIAYITPDDKNFWHICSGYIVLALIIFRVVWGLIGSKYARFSDFVYPPRDVVQYLKESINNNPTRYIGHNPAGGAMIIALLASLFIITISGLNLYAIEEGREPLVRINNEFSVVSSAYADWDKERECEKYDDEEDEFWEEIHEVSASFTLVLILLHTAGVIVSSKLHNENLVKSLITGTKKA